MSECFIDTSALLPFLNRNDADHKVVVEAVHRLVREGVVLVTASYTLVETAVLVRSRLGQAAFESLGHAVRDALEIFWVDEDLHWRAWAGAAAEPRRGPGLVDWVGFLVMKDLGIQTALALDRHFKLRGFSILP